MDDTLSILNTLMTRTESPKERIVLKYAVSLIEILHGKSHTKWSHEEYKRLPDILQLDEEHLMPMKHQGKGFVRWR